MIGKTRKGAARCRSVVGTAVTVVGTSNVAVFFIALCSTFIILDGNILAHLAGYMFQETPIGLQEI